MYVITLYYSSTQADSSSFVQKPYGFFPSKSSAVLVIGTIVTVIPVALLLWLGNVALSFFSADDTDSHEGNYILC